MKRLIALLLGLTFLFSVALAEKEEDASSVMRSDFTMQCTVIPDGFPENEQENIAEWAEFLGKISLRGVVDTQDFPSPNDRVYFNGGLAIEGNVVLPFEYDGYHSYRYVRSPALDGASIHFQMHNFFEFMLKPYYYVGIPTNYIALLLYPEATQYLIDLYIKPFQALCEGEGNRVIKHPKLRKLSRKLDRFNNRDYNGLGRVYFYCTSLLSDLGVADDTVSKLGDLETYLSFLDPEKRGLHITENEVGETYRIGEYTILKRGENEGNEHFTLTLPDMDGYLLTVEYQNIAQTEGRLMACNVKVTQEGNELLGLAINASGLPDSDETMAKGKASIVLTGESVTPIHPLHFTFDYSRSAIEKPHSTHLKVNLLHPKTNKEAYTLVYNADSSVEDASVMVERAYDNQDDFFNLNESMMSEYKERFIPTLTLSALPFLFEMPPTVINDIYNFAESTDLLSIIGVE